MSAIENAPGDTRETIELFDPRYVWDDLLDRHLDGEFDIETMKHKYVELAAGFTHSSLPGVAIEASTER